MAKLPQQLRRFLLCEVQPSYTRSLIPPRVLLGPRRLYQFTGNLMLDRNALSKHGMKIPIGPSQVVLRGCNLRNTPHAYGVVVYAGAPALCRGCLPGLQGYAAGMCCEGLPDKDFLLKIIKVGQWSRQDWTTTRSAEIQVLRKTLISDECHFSKMEE